MNKPKDYLRQPYARIVVPVENSGFHAEILEFPGCYAEGSTLDEAYDNLESAAESWIQTAIEQGQEIPEPSNSMTYSGRIVLRLPRLIHKRAAQLAERDQTSLNTYLVSAVSQKVGAEDLYNILTDRLEKRIASAASSAFAACYSAQALTSGVEKSRVRMLKFQQTTASTASPQLAVAATRR